MSINIIDTLEPKNNGSFPVAKAEDIQVSEDLRLSKALTDYCVTPQMYGAKGDGVADDTEAIKQLLSENLNIYFPEGIYKITDTLPLAKDNQTISGASFNSIIKMTAANKPVFEITKTRLSLLTLKNITLKDGTYGLYSNASDYCERALFENINFETQSICGVYFSQNAHIAVSSFIGCVFRYSNGGIKLLGYDNNLMQINRCRFEGLNDSSIYLHNDHPTVVNELSACQFSVTECRFEAHDQSSQNVYSPIDIEKTIDFSISNCYFENLKSPIFKISSGNALTRQISIINNYMYNSSVTLAEENIAIQITGICRKMLIIGNSFSVGENTRIIGTDHTSDFVVLNNQFIDASSFEDFTETSFTYTDIGKEIGINLSMAQGKTLTVATQGLVLRDTRANGNIKSVDGTIKFYPLGTERFRMRDDGRFEVYSTGKGIVLRDAAAVAWEVTVDTNGQLVVNQLT